jgi:hypothetical protein
MKIGTFVGLKHSLTIKYSLERKDCNINYLMIILVGILPNSIEESRLLNYLFLLIQRA